MSIAPSLRVFASLLSYPIFTTLQPAKERPSLKYSKILPRVIEEVQLSLFGPKEVTTTNLKKLSLWDLDILLWSLLVLTKKDMLLSEVLSIRRVLIVSSSLFRTERNPSSHFPMDLLQRLIRSRPGMERMLLPAQALMMICEK